MEEYVLDAYPTKGGVKLLLSKFEEKFVKTTFPVYAITTESLALQGGDVGKKFIKPSFSLTNIWELAVESYPQATTESDTSLLSYSMLSTTDPNQEDEPEIVRTSVVRLLPNKSTEAKLKSLCSITSKLWNEVTYARRMQFFGKGKVDMKTTYKEFQEKYKKLIGIVTAQQILNKNNQAWSSFFKGLKKKKEGGLPGFIKRVNPPGYKKRGKSRELWVVLRNDQYEITENKIIIKWLGAIDRIEVEYSGLVHLKGKQGSLEIHYDSDTKAWYAFITYTVTEKAVRGEWRKIPQKPKGNLRAGIDLGINNFMAIYTEDGSSLLVNGRPLKAESHYWRERISEYQSKINKYGIKTTHRLNVMHKTWRKRAWHFIDTQVRRVIEWLYEKGVSIIYVGHPMYIAQQKGNFNVSNVWSYKQVIDRLKEVAEEYGMIVEEVDEAYTSSTCPVHGDSCGKRIVRGLFKCTILNKVFNADVVGAFNILRKSIAPSPSRDRGNRLNTQPGVEHKDVTPNLSALSRVRTLAL